jgi:threonine/homoserine/homoserine lactone efflux protein
VRFRSMRGAHYARRVLQGLTIGAVAFVIGLSGALSPGPLTVLAVREAPRRGWWAGPLATAGHAVVELALVIALALGLAAFVKQGTGTAVIAFLGGGLLVWMGVNLLRTFPRASLGAELAVVRVEAGVGAAGGEAPPRRHAPRPDLRAVLAVAPLGALVSVANPYWVIWWATIGTKLTSDSLSIGWPGPIAVFLGHILSDLAWLSGIAALVSSGSRRFRGDGWYRGLLGVCGVFLLAIGAFFVVSGARFLA